MFNISLGIISLNAKSLTVWSNSSLFCHRILNNNHERCRREKQSIIDYVTKKCETIKYTCYMGITYFAIPIFYHKKLIAICLGGGVYMEENNQLENSSTRYDNDKYVPAFSEDKLNDIIKLLESVFNLVASDENVNNENDDKNEKDKQDLLLLQSKLSLREIQVVKLINKGLSNKEISARLNISEKTVKTHITNILRKLNMKDRLDIVIFCKKYC